MSYGKLSPEQEKAVAKAVKGGEVFDLGAGYCELSLRLLSIGATKVVAVDKEAFPVIDEPRLIQIRSYFENLPETPIDVAFISWPANRADAGLLKLVQKATTVIYLGKNTDGSACGSPGLFSALLRREVLAYIPVRPNTLIIYGEHLKTSRTPKGEERAGLGVDTDAEALGFEAVEIKPLGRHHKK